ncbi:PIAS1 isoform 3, partial [Pan troglodytes]
ILSLPHQASPVSRTPSLPAVDTSYINTSLIQDYRHPFHMTPMPYDLQALQHLLACRCSSSSFR